jgi:hypothetical protein
MKSPRQAKASGGRSNDLAQLSNIDVFAIVMNAAPETAQSRDNKPARMLALRIGTVKNS